MDYFEFSFWVHLKVFEICYKKALILFSMKNSKEMYVDRYTSDVEKTSKCPQEYYFFIPRNENPGILLLTGSVINLILTN